MVSDLEMTIALKELGLVPSDNAILQLTVLREAMAIYDERERRHQGLWKETELPDLLLHCRSKLARLTRLVDNPPPVRIITMEDCDDGLDLINYTAFIVRRLTGDV